MEGKNEELTCAVHSAWAKERWRVVNALRDELHFEKNVSQIYVMWICKRIEDANPDLNSCSPAI